jgi:hypothetical protein
MNQAWQSIMNQSKKILIDVVHDFPKDGKRTISHLHSELKPSKLEMHTLKAAVLRYRHDSVSNAGAGDVLRRNKSAPARGAGENIVRSNDERLVD